MGRAHHRKLRRMNIVVPWLAIVVLVGLLAACTGEQAQPTPTPTTAPTATAPATPTNPTPTPTPVPLKLLKTSPETGPIGTAFTVTGEGLPAGKQVEFVWVTWDGSYVTNVTANDARFGERKFVTKRVPMKTAGVNAQGQVSVALTAPEDYGEVHDIYAVMDGADVGKAGFRIARNATISPTSGPVGTPITITVKGLATGAYVNTMAIRYDNKYTGFVSAVTTRGSATFQIRAAGPVGERVIQLTAASPGVPFLNVQQSGTKSVPNMDLKFTFNVTEGSPVPAPSIEWPTPNRINRLSDAIPKTVTAPSISAKLEPAIGPTLTQTTLRASGLSPNTEVELLWVTGRGSDALGTRYLAEIPIRKATSGADGSLTAPFQITDDRGGWQAVKIVQGDKVLAEVPFYLERSIVGVGVTPQRVKAGETFTVNIKGAGWTQLDKGVAVTYDNAYIGYACGVTSSGDITMYLVATGEPGIHLIDLYPMIYHDKNDPTPEFWNYELPQLTALDDQPGLALGYGLPIMRLAVEVVK
ncbi:MAG: IPT/TIG domain-containing protein [Chloroflexi bacterium]|nr:IPT/TIG domain-containing protein [Chloroflexota bacterium]